MALNKQGYNLNFAQGLDRKTDPKQVQVGKFLTLENSVFGDNGALSKRAGFPDITRLSTTDQKKLLTLNDNLLSVGPTLQSFNASTLTWIDKGSSPQINLSTEVLVSNTYNQLTSDIAIASNGLACTIYTNSTGSYYQITSIIDGSIIVNQTQIAASANNPRVVQLGSYFIIVYTTSTPSIRYIAIPVSNPASPLSAVNISTQVNATSAFDCKVANDRMFVTWNGNDVGGAVRTAYLTSTLSVSSAVIVSSESATLASVAVDTSVANPIIWASFYTGSVVKTIAYNYSNLSIVRAKTTIQTESNVVQLTSIAADNVLTVYYQKSNTYSYNSVRTDLLYKQTVPTSGSVGTQTLFQRAAGLASKPFTYADTNYMLISYESDFQPVYYLLTDAGNLVAKLAYQNGDGYASSAVLPNVQLYDGEFCTSYLVKNLIQAVSKEIAPDNPLPIYTQNGINLVKFELAQPQQYSVEIAKSLQMTGGMFWQYDGVKPVENGFMVYPENVTMSSTTGGSMTAQQYYYVFCYEWTDGQNILQRSAPSLPVGITLTTNTKVNINVPTLRQTYKTGNNPVRIVGYRWSTAQQLFYQFTSISSPTLNDTTVDSVLITDTLADSSILGNNLIYVTGGVLENVSPSGSNGITVFKNRVALIDAEDANLIRYSQPIVQNTPVEFNDALTIYVSPTDGAQGFTGNVKVLGSMDDKLIIFKSNSIYYVTGDGPDLTGGNNTFSEPTFITGTVGCMRPNSIALMPLGIMFQSDKGIWLLGRDLSTNYIGAAVEAYNGVEVVSALTIPGTTQVRMTLDNGVVLMYDYYYNQWGTFTNIPAISACLWQNRHTYLNAYGTVRQERPNTYLDGSNPVLLKFTTAWINLNALQGFQRAYYLTLLAEYFSPHKISVQMAYDYNPALVQNAIITPDNYNPAYGSDSLYGGSSPYGGSAALEKWRVFFDRQKCESFQITMVESFDPSFGTIAGKGFSMSGLNLVIGGKNNYPKTPASNSTS